MAALGHEHEVVVLAAAAFDPLAHHPLCPGGFAGDPVGVDVGGVDEAAAGTQEAIEDAIGIGVIPGDAGIYRAKTNGAEGEIRVGD